MKKPARKPKGVLLNDRAYEAKAAFIITPESDQAVYLEGEFYGETRGIHLTPKQVHKLAAFLSKASAFLKEVR